MENLNDKTDDVREALDEAWGSGNIPEACGILVDEVRRRCIRWLLNNFKSLTKEDAEDCFDAAIEGVLKRGPENVRSVYSYVFTSARHNALDMVYAQEHYTDYDPDWIEDANAERLLVVVEAALDEEFSVRVEQLRQLYALVIPRLSPNRRRLAELLVDNMVGSSNELLAEAMGISKSALKSLKSRTLSDFRKLLPVVADELGINFDEVLSPPPEVLTPRLFIPSTDDGENSL